MNKNIHIGLPIGTASILLIFLTLSLTSFAVLSLQTSVADMNLTTKSAEYTQDYYAAIHLAEGYLADKDAELSEIYASSSDENDYMNKAGAKSFSDEFAINEMQYLHVEVTLVYPSIEDINSHKKSSATGSEASFKQSCYFYISSFTIMTHEELLDYKDADVPVY